MSGDEGVKQQRVGGQTLTSASMSAAAPATPGKDTLVEQNARRGGAAGSPSNKRDEKSGAFPAIPEFGPNQRQYDLFFDIHRSNLLATTSAMLQQAVWPDPAPDAPFAAGGDKRFTASVNAAIRSRLAHWDGHRMGPLLYPGNPLDAFRLYIAADKEQMHEVAWSPSFGDAFARLVHQSIYESIRLRIGPRYRAALERSMDWPEPDQLIAGHPIDPIVAEAIATPGTVDRGQIAVVNASGPPKLQNVKARWLGKEDPDLWNFVEVTPSGASAEDVAAALWQDPKQTTNAYALTKVGDVFRVAPGHARPLLRRLYKDEVIGDSDSDPTRATQLLVLSKSKIGDRVRARWSADAAKANEDKPDPRKNGKHEEKAGDAKSAKQDSKHTTESKKPTTSQAIEIETSIGAQLEKIRGGVAGLGMSKRIDSVIVRHVARMTELSSGDPAALERWLPILQFQHTQLLAIAPRIPGLVERLQPIFYLPPGTLPPAKENERNSLTTAIDSYLKAVDTSDDPPASTQILAGVLGKEKQSAVEAIGQVQDSTRQATRDGVATRVGSQQGSVGIDDDLTRAREDAMSGRNKGSGQYDEKKTIIRAGEISLRNRMNNVEQSIVMLREAAAAAGFSDLALLKKIMPNAKALPEILLDVHDHLRAVDRAWARGRADFDENEVAQAIPQGAPEDWPDWQEREAGLNAAREEFAHIAGDEDIGTFLREAQSKIRTQQMLNAVTTMASALLITMATGMGAAMLAETASVALVGESMTLAAQFTKGAIQVAISAPINSIVQLAVSGQDGSLGKAMLENALMDAFSRMLMFPLKQAERLAMEEVKQISQLQHVTVAETKAMASAASYAGTMMLAEGLTGMATQWAANRLVALVSNTHQEVSEPFALTVLQQGAAIGLGRFFAGRMHAWQTRRQQLAASRLGNLPEMHALFAGREAFYADAEQLANHPSPEPGASEALSKRDASLLREERQILGRHAEDSSRDSSSTGADRQHAGQNGESVRRPATADPEPTASAPADKTAEAPAKSTNQDGVQRTYSPEATKTLGLENRGEPYQDPTIDPKLPHKYLDRRELRPYRRMDPVFSWKDAEARIRGKQPAALGKKIKDADVAHALLQRLALGDATVLQELGVSGAPLDFDPSTREWALVQMRDGFAIMAGSYDSVSAPADVRTIAHNHPEPAKVKGHQTKIKDLPTDASGMTYAEIIKDPKVAQDATIVPSIKDIHSITDGADHTIYTRYISVGGGKITNPRVGATGARVQIHLSDTRVHLQKSRTKEYWYVTEMKVIDPSNPEPPLWEGTIYADWRALVQKGGVYFKPPPEFDRPEQSGWERV